MREPLANMGMVCPHLAPRPQAHFTTLPPEFFIGKYVKLFFPALEPEEPEAGDHMWVKVTQLAEAPTEELRGTLDNDAYYDVGYDCGDQLEFSRSEIEQVNGYQVPNG